MGAIRVTASHNGPERVRRCGPAVRPTSIADFAVSAQHLLE
jgi:hypothetical protein